MPGAWRTRHDAGREGAMTPEEWGTGWGYAVRAFGDLCLRHAGRDDVIAAYQAAGWTSGQERARQCAVLRDLFNPFGPGIPDSTVLAYNGAARRLAESIYAER